MAFPFSNQGGNPTGHAWLRRELNLAIPAPAVESYVVAGARRTVHYLFTKETRSSFALEGEIPSTAHTERFVAALRQGGDFDPSDKGALRYPSAVIFLRQLEQPLATPYANHLDVGRAPAIDNAKWWVDEFPYGGLIELRHDPSTVGKIAKRFDPSHYLRCDPAPDVRDTLALVPAHEFLQVRDGGFGKENGEHSSIGAGVAPSSRPATALARPPGPQVRRPPPA